jgi:hypothetical protein
MVKYKGKGGKNQEKKAGRGKSHNPDRHRNNRMRGC